MNGLEDLVRQTLAERAHDVDRVALNAPAPHPAGSRRWIAVATVVAVAAAILVAVVLIAPWHDPDRAATPADAVSGTQTVSFHGITLTVPSTWAIGRLGCSTAAGGSERSSVTVEASNLPNCPAFPASPGLATPAPVTTTDVVLRALVGDSTEGSRTTVAGHAALWVFPYGGPQGSRTIRFLLLPDAGVEMVIDAPPGDDAALQRVLDGIRYTPVDALGCAADLSEIPVSSVPPVPAGTTTAAVCEYDRVATGRTPTLLGSRVLEPDEIDAVRRFAADPAAGGGSVSPSALDFLVYRFTTADGSVSTLAVDPGATTAALPGAYSS